MTDRRWELSPLGDREKGRVIKAIDKSWAARIGKQGNKGGLYRRGGK